MNKSAKSTMILSVLALSIILSVAIYSFYPVSAISETSTVSNATIAVSIGFTFSGNLSQGILFGTVNPNTNNNNATGNYLDNANTSYYIAMDSANNIGSDTCIKAIAPLTGSSTTIANGNYTYDGNKTINGANMNLVGAIAITDSYVKYGDANVVANENQYSQYYLDIPTGQASGTYNNTISFKIVSTGSAC